MVEMRNFNPIFAEYAALVAVKNADWPDTKATAADWQQDDANRDKQYFFQRVVGLVGETVVLAGDYGEMPWSHMSGKYYFGYAIQPGENEQVLQQAFYDYVLHALQQREPTLRWLFAEAREDRPTRVGFLQANGFVPVMRSFLSTLVLANFDAARFVGQEEQMAALGLTILPLTTLQAIDTAWQRKYWELRIEIARDIPSIDPVTDQPFAEYLKLFEQSDFCADAVFLAVDQQQQRDPSQWRYVGLSSIWIDPDDKEKAVTDLTGVSRPYRQQGVATALKLQTIRYAQAQGIQRIETDNGETNPLYRFNLRLGFQPQPAWIAFQKTL